MLKIGLTGGIGSGKTLVSNIFKNFGIPIFYADIVARKLMDLNEGLKQSLINQFGNEVYDDNGFKKKFFAEVIFSNQDALNKANSIIHPFVFREFEMWQKNMWQKQYVIKEAAILFESGANKHMDKVITVYAPIELRIKRVMDRDGVSRQQVLDRIKYQISEEDKIEKSDYVIYNDNTKLIIPQVLKIHETLSGIN